MRSLPRPIFESGKLKAVNVYINFHVFFRTLLLDNKLPPNIVASPVAQMVKKLPAMQKTHIRSLGQEDALEKEMATHSSILAWKTPWTEDPDRL